MKKECLFVYGTLIDPEVQKRVFQRVTKGQPDSLTGYKMSSITFQEDINLLSTGTYPMIKREAQAAVNGFVLEVSPEELHLIDNYETEAYERGKVILVSGREAWVYREPESNSN